MRFQDIFASRWTVGFFFSTTRDFSIFGIFKYRWIFIAFIFVTGFVLFFLEFPELDDFYFHVARTTHLYANIFSFFFFFPHIFTYVFPNENDRTSKGHGKVGWFSMLC